MAFIRQDGKGWQVLADITGQNTDVASVDVADLFGDGTRQLIVGYSNASLSIPSKSLVIYRLEEGSMVSQPWSSSYVTYLAADYFGTGLQELAVVSKVEDRLRLDFIP